MSESDSSNLIRYIKSLGYDESKKMLSILTSFPHHVVVRLLDSFVSLVESERNFDQVCQIVQDDVVVVDDQIIGSFIEDEGESFEESAQSEESVHSSPPSPSPPLPPSPPSHISNKREREFSSDSSDEKTSDEKKRCIVSSSSSSSSSRVALERIRRYLEQKEETKTPEYLKTFAFLLSKFGSEEFDYSNSSNVNWHSLRMNYSQLSSNARNRNIVLFNFDIRNSTIRIHDDVISQLTADEVDMICKEWVK